MRILVLGAAGQLGRDLVPWLRECGHQVVAASRAEVDITRPEQVRQALAASNSERVVNCAAYTKVDQAEREPELAYAINRDGAAVVARECADRELPLCHISTDFVFTQAPSAPGRPWTEVDEPRPSGVYATSKRAGEIACAAAGGHLQLVRTAWLYGNRGPNFPLAIVRAAAVGKPIRVVADQLGSPTWTGDLAVALERLVSTSAKGTFHLSGAGATSWYGFASALLEELGISAELTPVTTAEWAAPAPRPSYSVLANQAWRDLGQTPLADWRVELENYVAAERGGAIAAAIAAGG
ncbi:MAG TPA: dTDP-4-dehydrorhamnose reductase [Candidatus Nanopelagicaceae bacterium]|nr:dTDP-4-dehydrorhamnose reductase [Candidatus Nanopelagicaceae bacterium]